MSPGDDPVVPDGDPPFSDADRTLLGDDHEDLADDGNQDAVNYLNVSCILSCMQ